MRRHLAIFFSGILSLFVLTLPLRAEVQLLMAEEPGCMWCARWNAEIGTIYPKTGEGEVAPLRRVDMTKPIPDDIQLVRRVSFSPTFVLLVDGAEVNRIEGYPGEDFFWGLLGQMLAHAEIPYQIRHSD